MTYEIRRGEFKWMASDYEIKYEQGHRQDHNGEWFRWASIGFHELGKENKRRKWVWADEMDTEIIEAETGKSIAYFPAAITEAEPEIVITEEMITDHHAFNNCGRFTLRIGGAGYEVKYDGNTKTICTEAPENIRKAIEKWWWQE